MRHEPNELCEKLKQSATPKMAKTIDLIHQICTEQSERGSCDFTIATIGRLSESVNGPKTQAIRNKTGEKYRALIQSWAEYKKPLKVITSKVKEQNAWVNDIDDARIKWLVMDLIAQNSKLTGQLQLAKELSNINIDLRPVANIDAIESSSHRSSTKSNLLPTEVEALSHSIEPERFKRNGWTVDNRGRVKGSDGNTIFKAGFVDAIEKILAI
ncbi:hypothetical protein LMH66_19210 [Shewanella sp. 10N.7]|uniref:gamma-mobile-trio protein GmtX n=1 Tax=Shewanella sp. 10N.7 TaxID=2885093 RepID=UPI001E2F3D4E|nr:gamma-mobile-trio protein GmtX [Shewanella sp. 10N.7]MCC4834776.1 hypothetical protein [Shewanella sp. 10N.7]